MFDRIFAYLTCAALGLFSALAFAQSPISAFPPGTFGNRAALSGAAAPTYQGPLDTFTTSPFAGYSCSEAPSAAFAATQGALCQFSGVTAGAVTGTCDLKTSTNGKADLASLNCVGNTVSIVTFCTVTNTSCSVSKAYDLTGNTRDVVNATLASMPPVVFSSSPTGTLPVINCGGGTNAFLQTASTFTQAQPLSLTYVANRNGTVQAGGLIGTNNTSVYMGGSSGANNAVIIAAGTGISGTASDNAWHAVNGLMNGNGTSSAINVDGTDTLGAAGTTGFSANNIRLCRANTSEFLGLVAEAYIWASSNTSTDRGNLSTNAHSANRYNF